MFRALFSKQGIDIGATDHPEKSEQPEDPAFADLGQVLLNMANRVHNHTFTAAADNIGTLGDPRCIDLRKMQW